MATIAVHNPIGPEPAASGSNSELPLLRESSAGVLENGKQNAEFIMTAIVEQLGVQYGVMPSGVSHTRVAPTPTETLDELSAKSDWVLVGSAD
jgi:hypothetical protein